MDIQNQRRYIAYIRKSTDVEDKQELSLEAQRGLITDYANKQHLNITRWFEEKRSAKQPGRPIFNEVMSLLQKAPTNTLGILAHKPDRLTRNWTDVGLICQIWDEYNLDLNFVTGRFENNAQGKAMFGMQALMAKWYVDNLGEETKKGLNERVKNGFFPGVPPLGYLTRKEYLKLTGKESDKREIDPSKAPLIKRAFEYYDLGKYSLDSIVEWAYSEGFRGRGTPKRPPGKVGKGAWYHLLTNHFYYGYFEWNKVIHKGTHEPIVDHDLWARVQERLRSKGHSFQRLYSFPFKLHQMRCGECGGSITAEQKFQMFCSNCRYKFHYPNKTKCPKCKTLIKDMDNPQYLNYTFYHCTRSRFKECSQKSVTHEYLEKIFEEALEKIILPPELDEVFREELKVGLKEEENLRDVSLQNLNKNLGIVQEKHNRLLELYINNELKKDLFEKQNEKYDAEKMAIELQIEKYKKLDEKWFKTAVLYLELSSRAKELFQKANSERKNELLSFVFQNLVLKDKKVDITYKKPFDTMVKCQESSIQLLG